MKARSPEQRILDQLVRAARTDPMPNLDMAELEAQVRQRWLAEGERDRNRVRVWFARWVPLAFAAAIVLVAGIAAFSHLTSNKPLPPQASNVQGITGDQLQVGQPIVTAALPLNVTHTGQATWTLFPRSRARIAALSPSLTLELETGRIDADVVPSTRAESFAIETRTHRIAVHGTRFSVEVDANELTVQVSSGAVLVTTRDQTGPQTRSLLSAPQRLRLRLQEPAIVPSAIAPQPLTSAARNRPRPPPTNVQPSAPSLDQVAAAKDLPQQPTALELETALDLARAAAARCFAQAQSGDAESQSDVRVRVETQLTLAIAPSGIVQDLSFMPPVPSEIADCTRRETREWSANPSRLGATASRAIILTK